MLHCLTVMDGTRLLQAALNKSILAQYFVVWEMETILLPRFTFKETVGSKNIPLHIHYVCFLSGGVMGSDQDCFFYLKKDGSHTVVLQHLDKFLFFVDEGKFLKGVGV